MSEKEIDAIKRHEQFSKIVDKHFKAMAEELQSVNFDLSILDYKIRNLLGDNDKYVTHSYFNFQDSWNIKETDDVIILGCNVDNFDMEEFLKFIHIDDELIKSYDDVDMTWIDYEKYIERNG